MAMDQSTPNAEDAADAGHPSGTALPAVATLLAETVRPADAENPEDAAYPRVNLRDPEAVWLPARHSRSRCRLLYWVGVLVLLLGVVCVPIAFFTGILTLRDLTETSNRTVTPVALNDYPKGSLVFANLQAKNEASLQPNRTLHWHSQEGAGSSNPYQGLKFNRSQKKLTVKTAGLYYVTLQLKLSPVLKNTDHKVQGRVSLALQLAPPIEGLDNSGLTVHLFPWSMEANLVEGSWSHLIPLQAGHCLSVKLSAYMDGAQEAYRDWQLSQTDITSFALFLVQPDTPQGLSATG
ncbi:tumor necrosis factor ligand superfamily member 9 isoform X1 [Mesocricetus auratus]|uniref:Tumor necrosis factor ligand superfamily member 9 isoform X1 n=1 Tax=Mesocricetus auratus TaxID=10036 RepID=A0A3Q0D4X5_MESAU|nr:tumor necrosis factor ligand superfamily member 9 isoform X1 [Mesocricetus auratus]